MDIRENKIAERVAKWNETRPTGRILLFDVPETLLVKLHPMLL